MVDLSKIEDIQDEAELQKLLSSTDNIDERKVIRTRLLAIKEIKSKEREQALKEREKRREEEIAERKARKEEEKKIEIDRLEKLAKTSTADRINTNSSKVKEEYIKDKAKQADEEKKKILESFQSKTAEDTSKANEDNLEKRAQKKSTTTDIVSKSPSVSSTRSATSVLKSTTAAPPKNSTTSAFKMFQNKDKEAGGSGKATSSILVPSSANNNPNSPSSIKENLLKWCQIKTEGYPNVNITNFSSSWADGMAFCALIHQAAPETFDFKVLNPKNRKGNFELAFKVAEDKCDIAPLLEVEDMLLMGNKPDWKCVFTYVQSFYRKLELEPRAKAAAEAKKNEH